MKKTHAIVLVEGQEGQTLCKGKRSRGAELAAVRNGAEKVGDQEADMGRRRGGIGRGVQAGNSTCLCGDARGISVFYSSVWMQHGCLGVLLQVVEKW